MGLDMYLNARRHYSGYRFQSEDEQAEYRSVLKVVGFDAPLNTPSLVVSLNAAYWRKANAIHAWFVKNVQDGKDECVEHFVPREQLKQLRDICASLLEARKVNAEKAEELAADQLPPQAGFFFGSTKLDEYYWEDLQGTVEMIDRALALPEGEWDFTYRSSW